MGKVWRLIEADESRAAALARELDLPPIVGRLMVARGIDSAGAAEAFLQPEIGRLHSWRLLKDIGEAVERLGTARDKGERVCVYGDYDADGLTGAALLALCLSQAGFIVNTVIPDRLSEGYGLSRGALEKMAAEGVSLVVTVDNGISAIDELEAANDLGMDVIVVDHHRPKEGLPRAVAIIDPLRQDCPYPFKDLAGVGLAYKLAEGLAESLDCPSPRRHLDLVAVGTVADVVPLVGENRILVAQGLKTLEETDKVGLEQLRRVAGLAGTRLEAGHIAFMLAPRINAAGRLGRADDCLELLVTKDVTRAAEVASWLDSENRRRQRIEEEILGEAISIVESTIDLDRTKSIVLGSDRWHQGVNGIVASRLARRFSRPTILFSGQDDTFKGSGRSIPALDLCQALRACDPILETWGGHRQAAGLTLAKGRLEEFRELFEVAVDELVEDHDLVGRQSVDGLIRLSDIDSHLQAALERLAPFGQGNPKPVLAVTGAAITGRKSIGSSRSHLKFVVVAGGTALEAVAFSPDNLEELKSHCGPADIAFQLDRSRAGGQPRLKAVDIRLSQAARPSSTEAAMPGGLSVPTLVLDADLSCPSGVIRGREARLVDRRGLTDRVDYVADLICAGARPLVYVPVRSDAEELGRAIDQRGLPVSVLPLEPDAMDLKLTASIRGDYGGLVFSGCPDRVAGVDASHLVLFSLPLSSDQFCWLMSLVSGDSPVVHLIYGHEDQIRLSEAIGRALPSRDVLVAAFKAIGSSDESVEISTLSAGVTDAFTGPLGSVGRACAQVFLEIGLADRIDGSTLCMNEVSERLDLATSATFRSGEQIRDRFSVWAGTALSAETAVLGGLAASSSFEPSRPVMVGPASAK